MENMNFFFVSIYTPLIEITRDSSEIEREKGEWFDYLNVEIYQSKCEINWEIEREREGEIERAKNYFHCMTVNLHVEI